MCCITSKQILCDLSRFECSLQVKFNLHKPLQGNVNFLNKSTFSFVFPALNAVPVAHMIYKIIINNNNKNNNNNSKIKDININNHNDNYYYYYFHYDHYHHYDRNSD